MIFTKVIKYEGDNKTFIWRHPITDFTTGSQLIVHESQEAVFMQDGKVMDTFGPGRHTLATANLPVISSLMKLSTGGRAAFHCELYFVNKTEQMAIPWGTSSKIQYMDPVYNFPVQLGACGEMSLTINNAPKLLIKVVGTEASLVQEQLTEKLRVFVMKYAKTLIPKYIIDNNLTVFELDIHLQDFSEVIQKPLAEEIDDYGLDLTKFTVMTILLPEDDPSFAKFRELHYRRYTDVAEAELQQKLDIIAEQTRARRTVINADAKAKKRKIEGYSYQEERAFDVAQDIAKNEAVGELGNIGIGMGMMSGVGSTLGAAVGTLTGEAIESIEKKDSSPKRCPHCNQPVSENAVFCEFCGQRIKPLTCPNCGAELSDKAVFCSICGMRISH